MKTKQQNKQLDTERYKAEYEMEVKYEREIIIMLLGNGKNQIEILDRLDSNMFVHKDFKTIFEAAKKLQEERKEINLFNVMENQASKDKIRMCEDLEKAYITDLNCEYFITRIVDFYINRLISDAKTYEDLKFIEKEKSKYEQEENLKQIGQDAEYFIRLYKEKQVSLHNLSLGMPKVDKHLGLLQGGDVLVLAGGTSMGKTCMAINIVNRLQKKGKVNYYSLEMNAQQLVNRLAATNLRINAADIRNYRLTPEQFARYSKFCTEDLKKLNINICTKYNMTIEDIEQSERKSDSDVVVIDYLGLLKSKNYIGKKYETVSEISRQIKLLANSLNKPIILLHQINREYMSRDDKRPMLCDLRDSGSIEQDADFVCFVHRPAKVDDSLVDDHIEFIIAKNRHGDCNINIPLIFNGKTQTITDPSEVYRCLEV